MMIVLVLGDDIENPQLTWRGELDRRLNRDRPGSWKFLLSMGVAMRERESSLCCLVGFVRERERESFSLVL